MAYRKPAFFIRSVFNPLAMRFGIGGTTTLSVPRRRSGGEQRVPLVILEQDGQRYLVSARGETDWVRNLRAAGGQGELERRGATERFSSSEVAVGERSALLEAYRKLAGQAVSGHFKALPDPADHPVFRLEPR